MSKRPSQQMAGFRATLERMRQVGELGIVVGAPGEIRQVTPLRADTLSVVSAEGPPPTHDPDPPTNAQLLAVHEYGDPARRIPERSVLRSTLREQRARALQMLAEEVRQGIANQKVPVTRFFARVAMMLEGEVKRKFGDSSLAPLSPTTIARKRSSKPLIDTGQLRRSIEGRVVKVADVTGIQEA